MDKRLFILFVAGLSFLTYSCKKDKGQVNTGTVTIDNTIYPSGNNYYALGFSFELEAKMKTVDAPGPDIVVLAAPSATSIDSVYLDTPNLTDSFALAGMFATTQEAKDYYNSLTQLGTYGWRPLAGNISANQIWVFRTRESHYVKIRITEVVSEMQGSSPYAEVTLQWRIQPDGSETFPPE